MSSHNVDALGSGVGKRCGDCWRVVGEGQSSEPRKLRAVTIFSHPESETKDLPSFRAAGCCVVISSLVSPFIVRPRQDPTDGLGYGV